MSSGNVPPPRAILEPQAWLWGGHPRSFFEQAGLRLQVLDGGSKWSVRTNENYLRTSPDLVISEDLAGPKCCTARLDRLGQITPVVPTGEADAETEGRVQEIVKRAESTKEPHDALSAWQLQVVTSADSDLATRVSDVHDGLLAVTGPDDEGNRIFAYSGVHLVRRTEQLLHRLRFPTAWLRIEHDPQLAQGRTSHLLAACDADESVFASSGGLVDGIFTLDAYTGPLLGAMSPHIWGFSATRTIGVVIFSLGQPLAGTKVSAGELLQTLTTQGASKSISVPSLSAEASSAATDWWARRLNAMFGVLGDLSVFTDSTEKYSAAKHLHALLSIEQLFRRVHSIQASYRDANARRVLLFTVLDTIERLTGRNIEKLCTLSFAEKTLELIAGALPADAAEVLLPAARRGVAALKALQNGFFLSRQIGRPTVELANADGATNQLSIETATARYVKVLRNATHGHGSQKAANYDVTNTLLAAHDGSVPHELASLGWLYLLRMLVEVDGLKMRLYAGGVVRPGQ